MTHHETLCILSALRCLVHAQLAHWSAPAAARSDEDEAARRLQLQALHWIADVVPAEVLAPYLRPLGGRLPPVERWLDTRRAA